MCIWTARRKGELNVEKTIGQSLTFKGNLKIIMDALPEANFPSRELEGPD